MYTTDDEAFGELAERVARDRGEELHEEFGNVLAGDEPVVWVDSPSNFAEANLLALQQRLFDRGPEHGAFGLITGYTAAVAEDFYESRAETTREDLLLFSRHLAPVLPDTLPDSPTARLLVDDEATVDAVETGTGARLRSFQAAAAGREIHISVSDGYLCGFPESQRVEDFPGPQPFCVTDGERDCPLQGDLLSTEAIDAAHVFLLSCTTAIDNGSAGLPVHAAMGLLAGADSLIGSYRVSTSRPHELLLHHSLLASGYDVSERCYVLNRNADAHNLMAHSYVAFGRPDAAVADPHEPQFEVDVRSDGEIEITDIEGYVVDVSLTADQVPSFADRLYVRTSTDVDAEVYYTVFEEDDDVRVILYTGGLMQFDQLKLELSGDRAAHVEREIALASVNNLPHVDRLGFLPETVDEQVGQYESQVRSFIKQTRVEAFRTDAAEIADRQLASLQGHERAIRDAFLDRLLDNPSTPHRLYAPNTVADDVYTTDRRCPYCQDSPVFVEQVADWAGTRRRLLGCCGRCGPIYNVPARTRDTDPAYPVIHCELDTNGERHQSLDVSFENTTETPMRTTFQPVVDHMDNVGEGYVEPVRREVVLHPGEAHTAEFTIDTDRLPNYRYKIRGQVVTNLDLYTAVRSTILGETAGYYPPHLR